MEGSVDEAPAVEVLFDYGDIVGHREEGAVDGEIIACGVTPLFVGEKVIVVAAPLVDLTRHCFSLFRRDGIGAIGDAADALLHGSVDKNVGYTGMMAKDIVGATTHNDKGVFLGFGEEKFADGFVEAIVGDGSGTSVITHRSDTHGERKEAVEKRGETLVTLLEKLRMNAGLLCCFKKELFVEVFDAELLGKGLAELAAAAAKLAADCYDIRFLCVCHE